VEGKILMQVFEFQESEKKSCPFSFLIYWQANQNLALKYFIRPKQKKKSAYLVFNAE